MNLVDSNVRFVENSRDRHTDIHIFYEQNYSTEHIQMFLCRASPDLVHVEKDVLFWCQTI